MARILVIDDEPNIRLMVTMALEQAGHAVVEAPDGVEGLRRFSDESPWDLVLLDQRMPGMEGLDVLRHIKELDPDSNVVMMTAYGTIDLALDAMEAGATDFLRKPFPLESLRGAVESARRHRAVSAPATAGPLGEGRFRRVTLNGFHIEPLREPVARRSGEIRQTVAVRAPNGNVTPCVVVFPPDIIARVQGMVGSGDWPVNDRFWQGLAEEMMAHYLWENASVPMGAYLRHADYTAYLDRWLSAVAGNPQAA